MLRDDRQYQSRGVRGVVKNRVGGCSPFGGVGCGFTSIEVAIKARKVTAGNLQADAVAGAEDVAGCPKVNRERIALAGD